MVLLELVLVDLRDAVVVGGHLIARLWLFIAKHVGTLKGFAFFLVKPVPVVELFWIFSKHLNLKV